MVSSRAFSFCVDGVNTAGLVPFAEMLNHKSSQQTGFWYSDEEKAFVFEACEDIKKGSEVSTSYGAKGNNNLLFNYGFIDHDAD